VKSTRIIVLSAAVAWAGICEAAYPGNPNFRNLAVTYAAKTRTSWETNAVTASLSRTVDWTKGEAISPGTAGKNAGGLFVVLSSHLALGHEEHNGCSHHQAADDVEDRRADAAGGRKALRLRIFEERHLVSV